MPGRIGRALLLRTHFVKALMLMLLGMVGVGIGVKTGQPFWKQSVGWLIVAGCFSASAVYFFRFVRLLMRKDLSAP